MSVAVRGVTGAVGRVVKTGMVGELLVADVAAMAAVMAAAAWAPAPQRQLAGFQSSQRSCRPFRCLCHAAWRRTHPVLRPSWWQSAGP